MSKKGFNKDNQKKHIVYTYISESDTLIEHEKEVENVTRPVDIKRKLQAERQRAWALGHTGPKPSFDRYLQGGNAKPRRKRREPSGHYGGRFYRP